MCKARGAGARETRARLQIDWLRAVAPAGDLRVANDAQAYQRRGVRHCYAIAVRDSDRDKREILAVAADRRAVGRQHDARRGAGCPHLTRQRYFAALPGHCSQYSWCVCDPPDEVTDVVLLSAHTLGHTIE